MSVNEGVALCCACDGIVYTNVTHSCFRGVTNNINRLREDFRALQDLILKTEKRKSKSGKSKKSRKKV